MPKPTVLIAGASGFVGRKASMALKQSLNPQYHVVGVTRSAKNQRPGGGVDEWIEYGDLEQYENRDFLHAFSCTGTNAFLKRWDDSFYQELIDSRAKPAQQVYECLRRNQREFNPEKKGKMVMTSGISYYFSKWNTKGKYIYPGRREHRNQVLTEDDVIEGPGTSLGQQMAMDLENCLPHDPNIKVVNVRPGLVCDRENGSLPLIQTSYILTYAGGYCKPGHQNMNYIHVDDLAGMVKLALEDETLEGPMNAVAPDCDDVQQVFWYRAVSKSLGRWPFLTQGYSMKLMQLMLGQGRFELACEGVPVVPKRALDHGYTFKYPTHQLCLEACAVGKTRFADIPKELKRSFKLAKKFKNASKQLKKR